ncbi:MAG: GNAT family N-acetyltransferase, partial [Pseudomonadota bacterium]
VDQGEEVIGCIGAVPLDDGGIELIKLYVRADARGQGLGRRLISQVETFACEREAAFIELWTDTRFTTAHIAYLACGYRKMADTRELRDKSNTIEYRFRKQLTKEA